MNGRLDLRIIIQPYSEVYWGYLHRFVFGNSLTKHNKLSSSSYSIVIFSSRLPTYRLVIMPNLPISHFCLSPVNMCGALRRRYNNSNNSNVKIFFILHNYRWNMIMKYQVRMKWMIYDECTITPMNSTQRFRWQLHLILIQQHVRYSVADRELSAGFWTNQVSFLNLNLQK